MFVIWFLVFAASICCYDSALANGYLLTIIHNWHVIKVRLWYYPLFLDIEYFPTTSRTFSFHQHVVLFYETYMCKIISNLYLNGIRIGDW